MLTIRILSANKQYLMTDLDWQWLHNNLGKPLAIMALNFDFDGALWMVSIYKDCGGILSLFLESQRIQYKIEGDATCL